MDGVSQIETGRFHFCQQIKVLSHPDASHVDSIADSNGFYLLLTQYDVKLSLGIETHTHTLTEEEVAADSRGRIPPQAMMRLSTT